MRTRVLTAGITAAGLSLFGAMSAHAEETETWAEWVALDTDDGTGDPYPGTWAPGLEEASANSVIVGPHEAHLIYPADDAPNLGTSIEVADLNLDVDAGVASVTYELTDGASVSGGAPRLFVEIDDTYYNTWDTGTTETDGASVNIPAGTVGHVGVAYDNGVPGTVRVLSVTLGETTVLFAEPQPEPDVCEGDPELSAEDEKCVEPDDTDSDQETDSGNESDDTDSSPAPVPTAIPAGAEPVNEGVNSALIGLVSVGLAALAVGGLWLRRRFDH